MNCEQVKELQIRYLAGELTPEERREFVEHVTCCSACERMFSETENVWNLVKDACTASRADKVLSETGREAIDRVLHAPDALHSDESERLFEQKLEAFRKRKIIFQIAAAVIICAAVGLCWIPQLVEKDGVPEIQIAESFSDTTRAETESDSADLKDFTVQVARLS